MILAGSGLYLAYNPFNAVLFDRLVAVSGRAANAGFLIYVADFSGYMGSAALLLCATSARAPWSGCSFHLRRLCHRRSGDGRRRHRCDLPLPALDGRASRRRQSGRLEQDDPT